MNPKLQKLKAMLRCDIARYEQPRHTAEPELDCEKERYFRDKALLAAITYMENETFLISTMDALAAICRDLPEDGEKLEVSDTPRTDAHQRAFNDSGPGFSLDDIIGAYDHARTLEIELRAANLKNAQEVLK